MKKLHHIANIIKFVGIHNQSAKLKETDKYLILTFSDVNSMNQAHQRLKEMEEFACGAV